MCPGGGAAAEGKSAKAEPGARKTFTFADLRAHASRDDAWLTIGGRVYNVTDFARRHPGGNIIYQGLAIDATILFETHHSMVPSRKGVRAVLDKHYIGDLEGWKPLAEFRSPFATELLARVRAYIHARTAACWWLGRRWDALSFLAIAQVIVLWGAALYMVATTGSLLFYGIVGLGMGVGHVLGHAANHYSLFEASWANETISTLCTNLWGLRERNWTFSHLLSHHCYNYADRDFMIEQHVPTRFFRTRPEEPWRPVHARQHYIYRLSPLFAFFIGAMRWDCAPWVFIAPVALPLLRYLGFLRDGVSSVAAPQFTASGSTHAESDLGPHEDGVGINGKWHVRESRSDVLWSLFLANAGSLPLFLMVGARCGFGWAFLGHSFAFGVQSAVVIDSLLTQHLSEDVVLQPSMSAEDDWYRMQIEASTSVKVNAWKQLMSYGINYQIEHHLFPCMCPQLLHEIAPLVREVSEKHGVVYNGFDSLRAVKASVYQRFKTLSSAPAMKSE